MSLQILEANFYENGAKYQKMDKSNKKAPFINQNLQLLSQNEPLCSKDFSKASFGGNKLNEFSKFITSKAALIKAGILTGLCTIYATLTDNILGIKKRKQEKLNEQESVKAQENIKAKEELKRDVLNENDFFQLYMQNPYSREAYACASKYDKDSISNRDLMFVDTVLPMMYQLDKAFTQFQPLESDKVVYRGSMRTYLNKGEFSDFERLKNCNVGDRFIPDKSGYSGTFEDKKSAQGKLACKDTETGKLLTDSIFYEIQLPKGSKVWSFVDNELKITVMPRNAEYEIIEKTQEGNLTKVKMKYVLPEDEDKNIKEMEGFFKKLDIDPQYYK